MFLWTLYSLCYLYCLHLCISLYTCANVICIKLLLTYLLTYLLEWNKWLIDWNITNVYDSFWTLWPTIAVIHRKSWTLPSIATDGLREFGQLFTTVGLLFQSDNSFWYICRHSAATINTANRTRAVLLTNFLVSHRHHWRHALSPGSFAAPIDHLLPSVAGRSDQVTTREVFTYRERDVTGSHSLAYKKIQDFAELSRTPKHFPGLVAQKC